MEDIIMGGLQTTHADISRQVTRHQSGRVHRVSHSRAGIIACVAVIPLVAGCGSSTPSTSSHITIEGFDSEIAGTPTSNVINILIKQFETLHPNVTIDRTYVPDATYDTVVKLQAASAGSKTEIYEGGPAYGEMQPIVKAGLLMPLDSFNKIYGWTNHYGSPTALNPFRYNSAGRPFSGSLYGIPVGAGEVLGAFYNKQLLSQLNLAPPQTFSELEASLAAAESAHITPISTGGQNTYTYEFNFAAMTDAINPTKPLLDWFEGVPGSSFDQPGILEAAQLF